MIVASFCFLQYVYAADQTQQSLSVTPPLFQLSVEPGDTWQSSVKVVNVNSYPLTVYAEVVNFEPEGEQGRGRFMPIFEEDTAHTLASWITIPKGPYVIPAEQSREINFLVDVPEDAAPGGHFAAILITTEPPKLGDDSYVLRTSQTVTSLFFVRIEGDVIEEALIREFSMKDSLVEEPDAEFLLRFENKGNVHLQPRGNIVITNMWGKERGVVPINHRTNFGNVLPESIREFTFSWKGEGSITEIGRYTAIATLAYGEAGVKSVTATTYFWVIPIKATVITVAVIIALVLFMVWAIKLYVRRVLSLAGIDVQDISRKDAHSTHDEPFIQKKERMRVRQVAAPIAFGARDLSRRLEGVSTVIDVLKTLFGFVVHYKRFFASLLILISAFVGITLYIAAGTKTDRPYEVTISSPDGEVTVDGEEILKDELSANNLLLVPNEQAFTLTVLNASGKVGKAAELAIRLEQSGYVVDTTTTLEDTLTQSTIHYTEGLEEEVSQLLSLLGAMEEIVVAPSDGVEPFVEVVVGSQYQIVE